MRGKTKQKTQKFKAKIIYKFAAMNETVEFLMRVKVLFLIIVSTY